MYLIEAFKKKVVEPKPTINSLGFHRYSRTSVGNIDDLFDQEPAFEENRYMAEFTCRELLLNDSGIWQAVFQQKEYNVMMGIRCYGEMYTIVSELLLKNKNSKSLLKKIVEDIFGITVEFRYGTLNQTLARRVFGHTEIEYKDGQKSIRGYITLYFNSWANGHISALDCGISAILAILKEPRIISGILDGSILDKKSMCKELIKIAVDRAGKNDDSYHCFSLVGVTSSTYMSMEGLKAEIRNYLANIHNEDGSDWLSIAFLAVFCYISSTLDSGYNLFSGDAGPADFIMENGTRTMFSEFREFLAEDEMLNYLKEEIRASDRNHEDEFYDFYEQDDTIYRLIREW